MNNWESTTYVIPNALVFIMAVMSYPILDTMRVFIVRIRQGRSPFDADRNHIHHRILDLGLTHKQATFSIAVTNVFLILFAFMAGDLYINLQLYILAILVPSSYLALYYVVKKNRVIVYDDWRSNSYTVNADHRQVNGKGLSYGHTAGFSQDEMNRFKVPESKVESGDDDKVRNLKSSGFIKRSWEEIKKLTAF